MIMSDVVFFESKRVVNPVFGTDFSTLGKVVSAPDGALFTIVWYDDTTTANVPLEALLGGSAIVKSITSSTAAPSDIWVGLKR